VIGEADELGISIMLLAGGEPLTRPEILDITADHPNIIFPLFTNGLLIDAETIDKLAAQKHVVPVISLEGPEPYTDRRRGPGIYRHLQATMADMAGRGIFFGTSLTVTRENFGIVTDRGFISELIARGCQILFYVDYVPVEGETEELVPTEEQIASVADLVLRLPTEFPALFVAFPAGEQMYGGCLAAGRGFVHISPGGWVEPCPFSPFSDTNLQEQSLKDALGSRLLRTIRESDVHLRGTNRGCALWEHREWVASLVQPEETQAGEDRSLSRAGEKEVMSIGI
jgi:MoaA/NifB/PqqE/SkfB family radical SAM enzyme